VNVSAHRQGLGNTGRLDHQVIKAAFARKLAHLDQKILPQRAANAAVRHLDQFLFGAA
jgi:hypothetical protein